MESSTASSKILHDRQNKPIIEALDLGFIKLMDSMGDDLSIINAARVSFGKQKEVFEISDKKLLKYLWDNKHGTPFEMVQFKFHVCCPLFVARQWQRHRMASYNEISRRYTEEDIRFHVPKEIRNQATDNKQASEGINKASDYYRMLFESQIMTVTHLYENMLANGVCREQARMILPQNMYTEFYYNTNLRSLINFLELRDSDHAQYEIREYAIAIKRMLKNKVPHTMEVVF